MSKVYLLAGPPGAGKSTYAQKQAAETGGVVIDYDQYLAVAPDADTAERWRLEAEGKAHELGKNVYIIRTLAKADERAAAAERIKADETIVLLTSSEVSKARVSERDGDDSKHQAIDAWWQDYTGNEGETTITFDGEEDPATESNETEDGVRSDQEEPAPATEPDPGQNNEEHPTEPPGQAQEEQDAELQAIIDAAREEERAKVAEEFALERFNTHLSAEVTARKLNAEAIDLLQGSLAPHAFINKDHSVNAEKLTAFLDTFTRRAPRDSHAGHRGTTAVSGKALGKALADEYLNRKGR